MIFSENRCTRLFRDHALGFEGGQFNRLAISCSRLSYIDFCGAGLPLGRSGCVRRVRDIGRFRRVRTGGGATSGISLAAGSLAAFGIGGGTGRASSVRNGRRGMASNRGDDGAGVNSSMPGAAGSAVFGANGLDAGLVGPEWAAQRGSQPRAGRWREVLRARCGRLRPGSSGLAKPLATGPVRGLGRTTQRGLQPLRHLGQILIAGR